MVGSLLRNADQMSTTPMTQTRSTAPRIPSMIKATFRVDDIVLRSSGLLRKAVGKGLFNGYFKERGQAPLPDLFYSWSLNFLPKRGTIRVVKIEQVRKRGLPPPLLFSRSSRRR